MVLAQITDIHLGHAFERRFNVDTKRNFLAVLDDLKRNDITNVVCTGDIAEPHMVEWFYQTLNEYKLSSHIVLGNHDSLKDMNLPEEHIHAGQYYYCTSIDTWKVFFLDTKEATLGSGQLAWLLEEIEAHPYGVVLFVHHPILDFDDSYMDRHYPLRDRATVRDTLCGTGKDIHVFCGHYHALDDRSYRNITQHITPSVFYQVKKHSDALEREEGPIGYRTIELGADIRTGVILLDCD